MIVAYCYLLNSRVSCYGETRDSGVKMLASLFLILERVRVDSRNSVMKSHLVYGLSTRLVVQTSIQVREE